MKTKFICIVSFFLFLDLLFYDSKAAEVDIEKEARTDELSKEDFMVDTSKNRVLNRFRGREDCDVFDDAWECEAYPGCYWDNFDKECFNDDDDDDSRITDQCHKLYKAKICDTTAGCYWNYDKDKCYYEEECYNLFRSRSCESTNDCIWFREEEKCVPEEELHDHKCRKKTEPRQCKRAFGCRWDRRDGCVYDDYIERDNCEDLDDWECKRSPKCLLIEYGKRRTDCINKDNVGNIDCWDIYSRASCESIYTCEWDYEKGKCYRCV